MVEIDFNKETKIDRFRVVKNAIKLYTRIRDKE